MSQFKQIPNTEDVSKPNMQALRRKEFPGKTLNLNVGTFGTPYFSVLQAYQFWNQDDLWSKPSKCYERAGTQLLKIKQLCYELWPTGDHYVCITHSTTQALNILLASINAYASGKTPIRVITSPLEHEGGIGGFLRHPSFVVEALPIQSFVDFSPHPDLNNIDICFLSQTTYASGLRLPIDKCFAPIKEAAQDCLLILDVAQSLGRETLELQHCDIAIGSTHKWLFGPRGLGLMWIRKNLAARLPYTSWGGDVLDQPGDIGRFEPAGGFDFLLLDQLLTALSLYKSIGPDVIHQELKDRHTKALNLCAAQKLPVFEPSLDCAITPGTIHIPLAKNILGPVRTKLEENDIYAKFLCHDPQPGLRLDIPYYLSDDDLTQVITTIAQIVREASS